MPRPKTKTKSEDLERIRNNQRRSRARRLEYVRDLEKRLKDYEELTKDWPDQLTLQKLRAENDSMKQLLDTLGISQSLWNEVVDNRFDTEETTSAFLSGSLTRQTVASPPRFAPEWGPLDTLDTLDTSLNTADYVDFAGINPSPPPLIEPNNSCCLDTLLADFDLGASGFPWPGPIAGPRDHTGESTTLCSLAYQWVVHCNKRALDLRVIHIWMQRGFQKGRSPMEGCRIDNKVLLAVLTEIS